MVDRPGRDRKGKEELGSAGGGSWGRFRKVGVVEEDVGPEAEGGCGGQLRG